MRDIIATLRFLADDWIIDAGERQTLTDVAQRLEGLGPHDAFCPLCSEVECDQLCPVRPYRAANLSS